MSFGESLNLANLILSHRNWNKSLYFQFDTTNIWQTKLKPQKLQQCNNKNIHQRTKQLEGSVNSTSNSSCRTWKHIFDHHGRIQMMSRTRENYKSRKFQFTNSMQTVLELNVLYGIHSQLPPVSCLVSALPSTPTLHISVIFSPSGQVCVFIFYHQGYWYSWLSLLQ